MSNTLKNYEAWLYRHWESNPPKCENPREFLSMLGLGLTGESGEVADEIKKGLYYHNREVNRDKVKEELGDTIHYWFLICVHLGLDPHEVIRENVEKLELRYNGLSQQEAQRISESI